ncbi:MAG: nuclear transport factor 2 family protein [Mycobacteriaceae bacterium]
MNHERAIELAERLLESWNTQDVERLVDCYTDDVRYRDPNTRGFVEGSDALRRYLTKLFDRWQMHWALREAYPFQDGEGAAVLWRAGFGRGAATARWRSTGWTWPWSREIV